jgi:prepilin-type N-terminal cleavage/methylation domain-containing protein
MRIFVVPKCSLRQGFTLLEMLVVLVLLALMAGISMPVFQSLLIGPVQREATQLASLIRALRNEAVLTRTDFHLVIDPKARTYWVEQRTDQGFRKKEEPAMLRPHLLPASFVVQDVSVLGTTTSLLDERPIPLTVDASGFVDPFLLHFSADGTDYTFKVSGFRAELDLLVGYVRE